MVNLLVNRNANMDARDRWGSTVYISNFGFGLSFPVLLSMKLSTGFSYFSLSMKLSTGFSTSGFRSTNPIGLVLLMAQNSNWNNFVKKALILLMNDIN